MHWVSRAFVGATGGFAAVLAKYISQDHSFVSYWANIHDPRFNDIVLGYLILTPVLVFLGAAVAGFSDETNKLKLLAMGVAAPALVTTMAGGGAGPSMPPANRAIGPAGWNVPFSPMTSALAAEKPTIVAQTETDVQKGVAAFFGAGKGEQKYWVIAGSSTDKSFAEGLAKNINMQSPDLNAFVGKKIERNAYYPVIVGDFSSEREAERLIEKASHLQGISQPYLSAYPNRRP